MKTSSLVDYEDSEDETQELTAPCKQGQDAAVSSQSQVFMGQTAPDPPPPQRSSSGSGMKRTLEDLQSKNTGPQVAASHVSPRPDRASVIRPYIPKRQRLSASEEAACPPPCPPPPPGGSRSRDPLEVSDRLKAFLDQQAGGRVAGGGIPRRLLLRLGGHRGPVNSLQWCPVPQLSHLLLSASTDKTLQVWDGVESGRSLRVSTCHSGAVRDACWTPCGRRVLSGSFDCTAVITDVETGQPTVTVDTGFRVMCVTLVPGRPDVFLCGGNSPAVKAWDSRCCKVVRVFSAGIQQTLALLFLRGGSVFISSSDCVSRDSADRTLMVWDFQTTARLSNQIYQERYTCPSLALHPLEDSFLAQTNGNYVALFSTQRPFRMNKRRRYEGHKVEGYAVQCSVSADGSLVSSGSSTGCAHFYDYHTAVPLHSLQAHSQPCLCISQHALLPATVATADWAGEVKVWI